MSKAMQSVRMSTGRRDYHRPAAVTATRAGRQGFSLMEVMIATAILMGSAVVLARLAGMGREQSQKARLHSDAQELCEQTMNELLLGLRSMELVEAMPLIALPAPIETSSEELTPQDPLAMTATSEQTSSIDETNPEWRHSIRFESLINKPGMWCLTVEVREGDLSIDRPVRFSLTRWIAGPTPEGAFEELSQGLDEPSTPRPGGLL